MKKWEYKVLVMNTEKEEEKMNELGKEGWKLVSVRHSPIGLHSYYFKRPLGLQ
jgi:hypothetical protein